MARKKKIIIRCPELRLIADRQKLINSKIKKDAEKKNNDGEKGNNGDA